MNTTTLRRELTALSEELHDELAYVELAGINYKWEDAPSCLLDKQFSLTPDPDTMFPGEWEDSVMSVFTFAWTARFVLFAEEMVDWDEATQEERLRYKFSYHISDE